MCTNNKYAKSTIEVNNVNAQTILQNNLIVFTNTVIDTGCSISYNAPSSITLKKAGIYLVLFTATINTGTTAGNITTAIRLNNDIVASNTILATTTASTETIIIPKLVMVPKSCDCIDNKKTITIINTDLQAVYNEVDLMAIKLA